MTSSSSGPRLLRQPARWLSAFTVTPAPARWFAFQPAHRDKQSAKDGDIRKKSVERCGGWKQERAGDEEPGENTQDQPALPTIGDAPAPTVALGRKPIIAFGLHGTSSCTASAQRQVLTLRRRLLDDIMSVFAIARRRSDRGGDAARGGADDPALIAL